MNGEDIIDIYIESVLKVVETERSLQTISGMISEVVKDFPDTEDLNFMGKICVAIGDIFYKLASLFTKGKVSAKARTQHEAERKIAKDVQKYGYIRVKILDVWTYSKYADRIIDNFTKSLDKKIVREYRKNYGGNRGIKILTDNMYALASAMRHPTKKATKITNNNHAQVKKDIINNILPFMVPAPVLMIKDPFIDFIFQDSPRRIGTEIVTLKELYTRLVAMKPNQFPQLMKDRVTKVNTWMQRKETLEFFRDTQGGGESTLRYSTEISSLLTAYSDFYQSMIDYYLSVITSAISEGKSISAEDIYKPTEKKRE